MAKVEIFTYNWCPYSKKALEFLDENNIPYSNFDITEEADEYLPKLKEDYHIEGEVTMPQIIVNGKRIGGYDDMMELHASGDFLPLVKGEKADEKKINNSDEKVDDITSEFSHMHGDDDLIEEVSEKYVFGVDKDTDK